MALRLMSEQRSRRTNTYWNVSRPHNNCATIHCPFWWPFVDLRQSLADRWTSIRRRRPSSMTSRNTCNTSLTRELVRQDNRQKLNKLITHASSDCNLCWKNQSLNVRRTWEYHKTKCIRHTWFDVVRPTVEPCSGRPFAADVCPTDKQ